MIEQLKPYLTLFGENTYLQAIVVLFAGLFLGKLVNYLLSNIIHRLARISQTHLDDKLLELIRPPVYFSVILVAATIAVSLAFSGQIQTVLLSIFQTIAIFIWSVFIVRLTRLLLRAASEQTERFTAVRTQTLPLFENLAIIIVLVLSIYIIFSAWNVDMTAWLASAGIIGIAVGFASKDTLSNLFSGVFILADAPYKIGDFIVLDSGERGEVTHIGIRSTRLLTRDDVEVTIPNAIMGNSKITNESGGPHTKYRIRLKVGVAYGTDIDVVKDLLMQIALEEGNVCHDPEPRVRFRQFGGSSLDFELLCWVDEPVLRGRVLDRLNSTVYKQFQEKKIEIPYAKQDLYIKSLPADFNKK
ncbi:MAG: mechanosensitive ion channel family protein [Gammaproteobacteria bacterium]|nr:mechanosensitive ion channel family protein [Gammaproteobacteria bacterium]